MNNSQRRIVVLTLPLLALMLSWLMLRWGDQWGGGTQILVFYEAPDLQYRNLTSEHGIYARFGIAGVLLGVVVPPLLIALSAFIHASGGQSPAEKLPGGEAGGEAIKMDAKTP